jgi:hypothetical protein
MQVMKAKIYFLFIMLVLASSGIFGQEASQRMKEAGDLYQKGDYFSSAAIYKQLYKEGYRSENLLFNAGNACFKANEFGYAVLFFERAKLQDPADEDVNYNLQIAKSHITDKFDEIPKLFFVRWFDFLSLLTETNKWAIISVILFIITLLLTMSFIFAPVPRLRYPSFWTAILTLVFSVITLTFALRNNKLVNHNDNAVVICDEVVGKSSPGDNGKDLFVIHSGAKVVVVKRVEKFSEIRLPDGNKGWVTENCVESL